jgi:hypothetical protein
MAGCAQRGRDRAAPTHHLSVAADPEYLFPGCGPNGFRQFRKKRLNWLC